MNPLSKLVIAAALLVGVAVPAIPSASAMDLCSPSGDAGVCVYHVPYSGSLYCEKAWSVGAGSDAVLVFVKDVGYVWVYEGYWCYNYSNYGENPYQSSNVVFGVSLVGENLWVGFGSYYETYYTGSGGPQYREGCYAFVQTFGTVDWWTIRDCPETPAPWGTLLTPAFQNYVAANADCKSGSAPTVQVCWRGNTNGYYLGFSACDATGSTELKVLDTKVDAWAAGIAGCLVFRDVLGA